MLCKKILLLVICFPVIACAQKRPNIIYMMADDLGYADLSCYGRKDYKTPNLDKLRAQGVKFLNAYAAAPVCTPTRAAFMTGRYPARTPVGLYEPIAGTKSDTTAGLSPTYTSIAKLLHNAGYETNLVGKWHLGFLPQYSPISNGFDYFYGFHAGATDYFTHSNDLYENETAIQKEGYATDLWADKTVEIIRRSHTKPFFISLMFNAPHWPWQGPADKAPYPDTLHMAAGGDAATYAAMVTSMDNAIGKIMNALEEAKLASNTVVIFTSDNGGEKFSDMGIYKGKKLQLWEGGIREPAIIRWPGKIPENSTSTQVATTMDWTATILSLAGGKPDPKYPLDGIDIMPFVTGKKKEVDRELYWRIFQRRDHKAMLDGKWKYLRDEKGEEYLFDLSNDPSEKNNLKETNSQVFDNLKTKYAKWEKSILEPIPLGK